jgi:hypothetical protein
LVIFATTDIVDPFIQTISYECVLINIIARNYFFCCRKNNYVDNFFYKNFFIFLFRVKKYLLLLFQ